MNLCAKQKKRYETLRPWKLAAGAWTQTPGQSRMRSLESFENVPYLPPQWVSLGKCWKTFFWKHPENAGTWSAWKSVHVIWCNEIYELLRTADLLPSVVRFNILRTYQRLAPQEWWLSFVAHRGQVLLRSGPWDITTSVAQSFESMMGICNGTGLLFRGDAWFDFRDGREACRICLVANNDLVLNRSNVWNGTD